MDWSKRYDTDPSNIEVGDIVYSIPCNDYGIVRSIEGDCDEPDNDKIFCDWANTIEKLDAGEFVCTNISDNRRELEIYRKKV